MAQNIKVILFNTYNIIYPIITPSTLDLLYIVNIDPCNKINEQFSAASHSV